MPQDPFEDNLSEEQFGSAILDPNSTEKDGCIVRVNPTLNECDVYADGSYYANCAIPGLYTQTDGSGGSVEVPQRGTPVRIRVGRGWPTITGYLPISTDNTAKSAPSFPVVSNLVGSSGSLYPSDDGANFGGRFSDGLLPGDKVDIGNQGQGFARLDGGVALMKGSDLSQVMCNANKDHTIIAGRNLSIFTGFGQMIFGDDAGKSYFKFEGGTDQLTQVGADKENWQVQALIGGEASGLLDFKVLNLRGESLFSFSIDPDGTCRQTRLGNFAESYSGSLDTTVATGRRVDIVDGDDLCYVLQGKRVEKFTGGHETQNLESRSSFVAGNRKDNVRNDWKVSVGRTMSFNVSGDFALGNPTTAAVQWTVSNGSVVFDIGEPLAGDNVKALSGFKVGVAGLGGIELATQLGQITMDASLPGSVWVGGGLGNIPIEPAVLGLKFAELMTNIISIFDAHIHPPTFPGKPVEPPLPPAQMAARVAPNVPFSLSKKVLIGP